MAEIIWSHIAIDDLRSIFDFIAKDSQHYAELVIDEIMQRVEMLQDHIAIGRVVPEFNDEKIRELIKGRTG